MDPDEFDELYEASHRRLTAQVYAMTGSWDEAQECVQEAFERAWARREQLRRAEHPEAWIRTTAHRLAISRWRRVVRSRRPADPALARPVVTASPDADHVTLVDALRQLPDAQRRALVLHYVADLSVRDVAAELGVAEGTVKARLSRGRAALAVLLADPQHDAGPELTGGLHHA